MSGAALAHAAQGLVGTRFRLGGRDPASGLDCLGVVAASLTAIGRPAPFPARRTLRSRGEPDAEAIARPAGLVAAHGAIRAGDVLLVRCTAVQLHVVVALGGERFVHAHAGLRRVVVSPHDPDWRIVGRWRLPEFG